MDVDKARLGAVATVFLDFVRLGYDQSAAEDETVRAAKRTCDVSQIMRGIELGRKLRQRHEAAAATTR